MARKKITVNRRAYTRRDGTRVKATTYKVEDRGARGRGPKVIPKLKKGGLGGPGYLSRSELGRHRQLGSSVRRDGYATTSRRLNALSVFGKRTMNAQEKARLRRDKEWLKRTYGERG